MVSFPFINPMQLFNYNKIEKTLNCSHCYLSFIWKDILLFCKAYYRPIVKEELIRDNERDIRNTKSPGARSQFFNSGKAVGGLINPAKAARFFKGIYFLLSSYFPLCLDRDEMARLGVDLTVDHTKRNRCVFVLKNRNFYSFL